MIALLFKSAAFCLQHIAVNVLGRMSNAALLCKMSLQSSLCEIAICSSPTKHSLKCIPPNLLFQKLQSCRPMHYPHAVLYLSDCNPDIFCSPYSPDNFTTQNAIQKSCLHFIILKLPQNSIPACSSQYNWRLL